MTTIQFQTLINGRYLVGKPLGEGTGSEAFHGEDRVLSRPIAIKIVKPDFVAAYHAALGATTHIGHPAFVGIFDSIEYDDRLVIVQEWMNGQRFADMAGAMLAPSVVARIGRQLALALAHAHRQGVVHGDLTPGAIFRDQWGAIRVNNVGLPLDGDYFAAAGHILAPGADLWSPDPPTIRDDLRAAGIALWLLLARRTDPPTEATGTLDDWQLVGREVPDPLRDIIERLSDPSHPRALDDAEAMASAMGECIRAIDPRMTSFVIAPWDPGQSQPAPDLAAEVTPLSQPIQSSSPPTEPATATPDLQALDLTAPAGEQQIEPQLILGPPPTISSSDAPTWIGIEGPYPQAILGVTRGDPAMTQPAKGQVTSRDYVLWAALGIALFIFWLIIGYLLPGLFGR
jgi:serine/threonine-protein kinase